MFFSWFSPLAGGRVQMLSRALHVERVPLRVVRRVWVWLRRLPIVPEHLSSFIILTFLSICLQMLGKLKILILLTKKFSPVHHNPGPFPKLHLLGSKLFFLIIFSLQHKLVLSFFFFRFNFFSLTCWPQCWTSACPGCSPWTCSWCRRSSSRGSASCASSACPVREKIKKQNIAGIYLQESENALTDPFALEGDRGPSRKSLFLFTIQQSNIKR